MLACEPLCLSTQTVIFLSLKLKRGLNASLPAHVDLGAPAFEYSNRDFFEPQKQLEVSTVEREILCQLLGQLRLKRYVQSIC